MDKPFSQPGSPLSRGGPRLSPPPSLGPTHLFLLCWQQALCWCRCPSTPATQRGGREISPATGDWLGDLLGPPHPEMLFYAFPKSSRVGQAHRKLGLHPFPPAFQTKKELAVFSSVYCWKAMEYVRVPLVHNKVNIVATSLSGSPSPPLASSPSELLGEVVLEAQFFLKHGKRH